MIFASVHGVAVEFQKNFKKFLISPRSVIMEFSQKKVANLVQPFGNYMEQLYMSKELYYIKNNNNDENDN